jgi:hypothetical protein
MAGALCAGTRARSGRSLTPSTESSPNVATQVNLLAKQLYGIPLDESDAITGKVQNLVLNHMQQWLENRVGQNPPGDVDVRRELERVFAEIQYPVYAWPAAFVQPWRGAILYGVGYTLGWSDYDRANVLAIFENRQRILRLAAVTHFVPHTDLHCRLTTVPAAGDFRVLVYGTRLGKSQRRLTAALYSFDGESLRSLWQIQDAYDGRISVGQSGLSIRYLKEDEYIRETARGRKPPRYESVYKSTPQGLELETTREIPF